MESFIIEGGHPLKGTIVPQGAKNEALEVICTTILTKDPVRIKNVPDILDVNNLIKLLKEIGVKVTQNSRNDYTFQSDELDLDYLDSIEFVKKCSSLRGSVLMIGPLLGRCGKATIAKPGGDKIGRRRLDTHFLGFKYLGAKFVHDDERNVYQIEADQLKGCYMLLDEASLRVPPISSWLPCSPRVLPLSIMQPVNPISSSSVICSMRWEHASAA